MLDLQNHLTIVVGKVFIPLSTEGLIKDKIMDWLGPMNIMQEKVLKLLYLRAT